MANAETALLENLDLNGANETTAAGSISPPGNNVIVLNNSNADDSSPKKHSTKVNSSDGKTHQLDYDPVLKTLEFTLLKSQSRPSKHRITLSLNEVLCVRRTHVKLSSDGLPKSVPTDDEDNKVNPNVLYIYYAFRRNVYHWRVREAAVFFQSTADRKEWSALLGNALKQISHRPKKLLIFINPFGGKGKANQIYTSKVEPIFDLVGVQREVIRTERANHAHDIMKDLDKEMWEAIDGLVSVGGDGLFNEILSSTIVRTQEEQHKDIADVNVDSLVTPRMRFGIIGAGSANSIVSSVHGIDDHSTAAIHMAIGSKCGVDVCTVHQDDTLLRISANAISYGWLGDVLHDSEHYRCMGPIRYQWSALRTSIRHPTYFVICCVIPCVSPFTPYGLAPYAGVGDGSMDLALVPKVSRFENLQIMRKVSMYGGKGIIGLQRNNLHVFRVSRWKFTPAAAVGVKSNGDGDHEVGENETQGAWNLDGEILPQPARKALHFRLHPRLINFFGRELDLDDSRYRKCLCCAGPTKYSKIVVLD